MIRFIESKDSDLYFTEKGNAEPNKNKQKECLVLDEAIWEKGRAYFAKNRAVDLIPVVNRENRLICYAWQDKEARREVRMLWELEACNDAIGFRNLHPDCKAVIIHGCNELAWYMMNYLKKQGIPVSTDGMFWEELGIESRKNAMPEYHTYEIWAEGVHQKSGDWKKERLRSASVEFECVDEIYEANIKAGKITDTVGNVSELLERLRVEREIVIRGTGTKAQDAYDWLLENDISICAFQSGKINESRKSLFGKPILKREEVEKQFNQAVILECGSKYSTWGFGDVDAYAYDGYKRNSRYLLLRDYLDVPENNLRHILAEKNLILTGDIRLCNRVYRWLRENNERAGKIEYWDILEENGAETEKFQIPMTGRFKVSKDNVFLIIIPEYAYKTSLTKEILEKKERILEKFAAYGLSDYTDYFSDLTKCIYLENEIFKYSREELRPAGILLGAIPAFSGNVLFHQILDGHQQVIVMDQVNPAVGVFLAIDLYFICIRLAEEQSEDILDSFWRLYQKEVGVTGIKRDFPDIEKFNQKMKELLKSGGHFSSQELFVMFHLANAAMYGREVQNLHNSIIYWEPHCWDRKYVREWAYWLGSSNVKGYTVSLVRNKYIQAGSSMRIQPELEWRMANNSMYGRNYINSEKKYKYWKERVIKFEELKCNPKETITELCEWLDISYNDTMMETTFHGKKAFFDDKITGFDVKPAYNLYEEYFTVFDRMRISLAAGSYQKQYGYPYIKCLEFTRRELQEMFLKDFRWEELPGALEGKNEDNVRIVMNRIRHLLWRERFSEIMEIDIVEDL